MYLVSQMLLIQLNSIVQSAVCLSLVIFNSSLLFISFISSSHSFLFLLFDFQLVSST